MTRPPDEQSAIRSVHFDRVTHTLRIAFEDGETYDFADVPEHVYDELARSPAPDEHFHANVRDEFIGTRVGEVDLAEMAHERREDSLLGPPLAERISGAADLPSVEEPRVEDVGIRGSRHTWVIDVIEDEAAAIEVDGRRVTPIPRWLLPVDARDGDVLRVTHARSGARSTFTIEVDRAGTRAAYQRSVDQLRDAPSGEGDIELGA